MTVAVMSIRETIERYAGAWKRGDIGAMVDCYHDDFTIHYFGDSPLAGTHTGKQAALSALGRASVSTGRQLIEVHDILTGGDHAALLVREHFGRDGKTLDVTRVLVFHVKDGKLSECWLYDDDQRAVDEFWRNAPN